MGLLLFFSLPIITGEVRGDGGSCPQSCGDGVIERACIQNPESKIQATSIFLLPHLRGKAGMGGEES